MMCLILPGFREGGGAIERLNWEAESIRRGDEPVLLNDRIECARSAIRTQFQWRLLTRNFFASIFGI